EALIAKSMAQLELERSLRLNPCIHRRLVEHGGAAPGVLRAIQSDVAVLQEIVDRAAVIGENRNADARADVVLAAIRNDGSADRGEDAFRDRSCELRIVDPVEHDGELIPAEPSNRIPLAQAHPNPLSDDFEQLVSRP